MDSSYDETKRDESLSSDDEVKKNHSPCTEDSFELVNATPDISVSEQIDVSENVELYKADNQNESVESSVENASENESEAQATPTEVENSADNEKVAEDVNEVLENEYDADDQSKGKEFDEILEKSDPLPENIESENENQTEASDVNFESENKDENDAVDAQVDESSIDTKSNLMEYKEITASSPDVVSEKETLKVVKGATKMSASKIQKTSFARKIDAFQDAVTPGIMQASAIWIMVRAEFDIMWQGPMSLAFRILAGLTLLFNGSLFYSLLVALEVEKWCNGVQGCISFFRSLASNKKDDDSDGSILASIDPVKLKQIMLNFSQFLLLLFASLRIPFCRIFVLSVAVASLLTSSPGMNLSNERKVVNYFSQALGKKWANELLSFVITFVLFNLFALTGSASFFHSRAKGAELLVNSILSLIAAKVSGSWRAHADFDKPRKIRAAGFVAGVFVFGLMCRYIFGTSISVFPKIFGLPFYVANVFLNILIG